MTTPESHAEALQTLEMTFKLGQLVGARDVLTGLLDFIAPQLGIDAPPCPPVPPTIRMDGGRAGEPIGEILKAAQRDLPVGEAGIDTLPHLELGALCAALALKCVELQTTFEAGMAEFQGRTGGIGGF